MVVVYLVFGLMYFYDRLHLDKKEVYKGTDLSCVIKDLLPNNQYAIQLKLSNAEEESDLSEPTIIQTDEAGSKTIFITSSIHQFIIIIIFQI